MPLIKRNVEPVDLCRSRVPPGINNELECVTNTTLANIIRQLSSLSKHAEDMFGEIFQETSMFLQRTSQLQHRVDRLKVKVTQLDSTVEEVSLQDINMRKPFKSSVIKDQQIITLETRPHAISEAYTQCDTPPALVKLNPYREDGKDSMKFYTDPTYFFELWCHEMQKDTEQQKKELKQRRKNRILFDEQGQHHRPKNRPPQQIREAKCRREDMQKYRFGKEFVQELSKPAKSSAYEGQARPSSLELQQYAAASGAPLTEEQYMRQRTANNGPAPGGAQAVPQYQPPPPYQPHPSPPPYTPKDYAGYQPEYSAQSPAGTPTRRSAVNRGPSSVGGIRPTEAPPMPPGVQQAKYDSSPMGNRSGSASRESLPPPPLPPPLLPGEQPQPAMNRATPVGMSPIHVTTIHQGSPVRHTPSPQHLRNATPDSMELPLPSPPPLPSDGMPNSMPAMPPLPPQAGVPLPPPLPPPNMGALPETSKLPNGNVLQGQINAVTLVPPPADDVSISSNMSSTTVSSNSTMNAVNNDRPAATIGCDLLNAIRDGIKLRKVEERRQKDEQKRQPTGHLDVQSIMEAAFEMRRKALEANDSDDDEEECDEGDWSGED